MAEQGKLCVKASAKILRYDENNNLIDSDNLPIDITPEELENVLAKMRGDMYGIN